jgi:phage shock protein B
MFWIFAIVAVVFGSRIWRTHLQTRHTSYGSRSKADEQLIGSMQLEINRLAERVQVLERLVTDDDRNLSREIDRLRERPDVRL